MSTTGAEGHGPNDITATYGKPRAETASEPVIAPSRRVKLTFLMMRADGAGGVPRTVVNLAITWSEHFDVRLISIFESGTGRHTASTLACRCSTSSIIDR
jgi:hypothetical protein